MTDGVSVFGVVFVRGLEVSVLAALEFGGLFPCAIGLALSARRARRVSVESMAVGGEYGGGKGVSMFGLERE